MKDRIFRFGLTGLIFILSLLFGFWYLGGDPNNLISPNDKITIAAITTIVSSPILGFILSSINLEIWKIFNRIDNIFLDLDELLQKNKKLPPQWKILEQEYNQMIYKKFADQSGIKLEGNTFKTDDINVVLLNHQALMRESENKEAIDFSTRRLDVFYTHINTTYTIIFGLFMGIVIDLIKHWNIERVLAAKGFLIIPILFYIFFVGRKQAKEALIEANIFERNFLLLKNKKDQVNSLTTQQTLAPSPENVRAISE